MWKKKDVNIPKKVDDKKERIETIADRICNWGEDYRNNLLNGIDVNVSANGSLVYFIIKDVRSNKKKSKEGKN